MKKKFNIKNLKINSVDALKDVSATYYITWNNKILLGNPLTKHYAKVICEWLNTINEKELSAHFEDEQEDDS